jgi:hypothetical protein
MLRRRGHVSKQDPEISSTDEGMQIDSRDEQRQNADLLRIETRLPLSNVTLERLPEPEKQPLGMLSMDEGMQMHSSDEHPENADWPRIEMQLSRSKRTRRKSVRPWKHPPPTIAVTLEIQTDESCPKYARSEVRSEFSTK